jgi:hypothetical protein
MERNGCSLVEVVCQNLPRRLGKTMNNLVQDNHCLGRDSNEVPPSVASMLG